MSIGSRFAPIGLVNMFNSGGAIKELKYETEGKSGLISMKVRGCGTFGAYSSTKPKRIQVHNEEVTKTQKLISSKWTIRKIKVAMENEVLTVTVPKEEEKEPEVKAIDIYG
ncbi:hypothetical protein P3S67_025926 [Capsicum chacoense]